MAWEYTLSSLFPEGKSFRVMYKQGHLIKTSMIRFDYGKTYRTEDEVLVKSLSKLSNKFPDNRANRDWLTSLNVPYEQVPCSSCGGRVIKLLVDYFIIKEIR